MRGLIIDDARERVAALRRPMRDKRPRRWTTLSPLLDGPAGQALGERVGALGAERRRPAAPH
jgi:hypothetical protein